jgi:hypothetical protein
MGWPGGEPDHSRVPGIPISGIEKQKQNELEVEFLKKTKKQ